MSELLQPRLRLRRERDFDLAEGDGWWTVEKGRFMLYRCNAAGRDPLTGLLITQCQLGCSCGKDDGRWWSLEGQSGRERDLLQRHGLWQQLFPTRRAALQRLQDALQLEEMER